MEAHGAHVAVRVVVLTMVLLLVNSSWFYHRSKVRSLGVGKNASPGMTTHHLSQYIIARLALHVITSGDSFSRD